MNKELYETYKAHGVCVQCKKSHAAAGRVICKQCNEKMKAYGRANRAGNNTAVEKKRERNRSAGLCIDCGKPVTKGHTRCDDCLYIKKVKARVATLKKQKGQNVKLSASERQNKLLYGLALEFIRRGYLHGTGE